MKTIMDFWNGLPLALQWLLGVVVVGVAVGFTANIITSRLANRVRVRVIRSSSAKLFRGFSDLYNTAIRPEVRVDIKHMLRYAEDKVLSPRSFRATRRRATKSPLVTLHLIVVATIAKRVQALAKLIVCDEARTLFIAYVASRDQRAMRTLFDKLHTSALARIPAIRFIAYEVDAFHATEQTLGDKFDGYAASYNISVYKYENYLMPDMDPSRVNKSIESDATLVVGVLARAGVPPTEEELHRMVRSIYFGIYADTFRFNENLDRGYQAYLSELAELVSSEMAKEAL